MPNFHVPLPDEVYRDLREEAARQSPRRLASSFIERENSGQIVAHALVRAAFTLV
jgi:hypothetical protein